MPRKEAYAAIALTEAVKVGIDKTSNEPASIVKTAELFYAFLAGEAAGEDVTPQPAKAATPKPAAPKQVATPVATKPTATKPAAAKPAVDPAVDPAFETVKGLVKSLIEANLRAEAIQLLSDHGAASTTALVALGPEAVEAFTNAANEMLATA